MSALPLKERSYAGQVVSGRYRVLHLLASGGMGAVWAAERTDLGGRVALKFARDLDEDAHVRFATEARIIAGLSSAHVVRIIDVGSHSGVPFLVMEYLQGETLKERLRAVGKVSAPAMLDIIRQIAVGLKEAHAAGITHRDLKPANIFLTGSSSSPVVKLLDFGIAKQRGTRASANGVLGTPCYMSPEQITAPERVGPETDLWSLAVISFECLVGRPAFAGESVADVLQAITHRRSPSASKLGAAPPSYDHWFSRATAKRAEDRFPSAPMLVRELETALGVDRLERPGAGDTVGLDTVQRATRAKHWAKTLPVVSAAVLVFGAVALWQLLPLGAWGSSSPADATNERELPQAEVDEVAISPPSGDEIEFLRGAAAATSLQRSARTGGLAGGSTPMAAEPGPRSKLPEPQSPPGGNRKIRSRPSRPPPSSEDAVWTERL